MKAGIPVIIGQRQEEVSIVFEKRAKELDCMLYFADQDCSVEYSLQTERGKQSMHIYREGNPLISALEIDLMGLYQQKNILTVLKALDVAGEEGILVSEEQLRPGLANTCKLTGLRGRWETIGNNPLVVCDTAHNPDGMQQVVSQLMQTPGKKLHIILGMVDDKDPGKFLAHLPREAGYYFTQASVPRAMDREKLARKAMEFGLYGRVCPTPEKALEIARSISSSEDLIFVGGSTFVVAEVL